MPSVKGSTVFPERSKNNISDRDRCIEMDQPEPVFSVVCVYNNKKILDDYLLKSLEKQDCPHETILLDNRYGQFPSAAAAFNSVLDRLKGELVVFAHQDISLGYPNALSSIFDMLRDQGEMVVAGVAGKAFRGKWIITNIKHGDPPSYAGKLRAEKIERVQTLDECLFVVSRKLLEELKFDQDTCSGWHLYAVEYCLAAQESARALVLPVDGVYHVSRGASMSSDYYDILKKVTRKYHSSTSRIFTTCGRWYTEPFVLNIQIFLKELEKKIKRIFSPGCF